MVWKFADEYVVEGHTEIHVKTCDFYRKLKKRLNDCHLSSVHRTVEFQQTQTVEEVSPGRRGHLYWCAQQVMDTLGYDCGLQEQAGEHEAGREQDTSSWRVSNPRHLDSMV